ncbi:DEAD/DEAH box helicase [Roseibaca sp. Y0-43]|uniref:DEAD/DEAH box helicase n=1 Tax=Roseibaca sp. Y0-43 TaxID=2816854 RepID=UPI001D0C8303|nr:DEAD/DEAH box helicase [Roseibaca sp. Y0-43]MCC1481846.1 DEAD/DEAH box helicase [Roseibaca sp. Y0-43]
MIPAISEALAERGYDTLTPVQQAVNAPELADRDLLVSAQTGSGKTVGFGLAIAPTLLGDAGQFGPASAPLALIVAPTRELASQVMRELTWLYARTGAVVTSCVGGMDMRTERRALERGAHIVVGTPGRLRDHIERGGLDLSDIRAVVLDEADEMLDMGFREDLEFMLAEAPDDRRTLLFSATVPPMIATLAQQYQRDAERISTLGGAKQHADIAYQAVRVAQSDVDNAIFNLLRFHHDESALVFANTRAMVAHLTARLANRGLQVVSLSGELSQTERTHALQAMRDGRARVCVATDVAARGIDLPKLNLVIHAELPTNTETLLHRSGRTGRAGRKGISALIVPPKARARAERLLKWAKITADWVEAPSVEDILARDEERLLSDPVWSDEATETEAAFAEKLLARHAPAQIAAAYLRLYQSRHAAPEDLLPPDTKPTRREKAPFGPSRWVALSVGRAERAEARWLLPLLCRTGGLDKAAIGAIRVQDSETYVEIAAASVDSFIAGLGDGGTLEDGVSARLMDSAPDLAPASRGPRPDRGDRAERPARPERKDRDSRPPREDRPERPRAAPSDKPSGPKPKWDKPKSERSFADKPKPRSDAPKPYEKRPARDDRPQAERPQSDRPKRADGPANYDRSAPRPTREDGPKSKGFKPKPDGGFGKPGGKPGAKIGDRPTGKPGGKPMGKPAGKPKPAADPRDTSKRFVAPGKGGNAAPRKPRSKPKS